MFRVGWYRFFFSAGSLTLFWGLLLYGESHAVTLLVLAILGGVVSLVGGVLIGLVPSFSANGSMSINYEYLSLCLLMPSLAFCLWNFQHYSQYLSFICVVLLAVMVGSSCVVIATLHALRRSRSTTDPGGSSGTNRDPSLRSGSHT
jgi:hypothetical protein